MQEIWITQCVAQALLEKVTINPTREPAEDDPQTSEQLYQINSCTIKKVLGPTTDLPTWVSSKGTENPQGI